MDKIVENDQKIKKNALLLTHTKIERENIQKKLLRIKKNVGSV